MANWCLEEVAPILPALRALIDLVAAPEKRGRCRASRRPSSTDRATARARGRRAPGGRSAAAARALSREPRPGGVLS